MARRLTDSELAERFAVEGGMTDVEAWAAVRFVRGGHGRRPPRRRARQRLARAA